MKNYLHYIILILTIVGCKSTTQLSLRFLDEYIVSDTLQCKNTLVGGLSGIDKANKLYYLVVDDDKAPRILKAKIKIAKDTISAVDFLDVIQLNDTSTFYKNNVLDLESIFIGENHTINLASEGSIYYGKNPSLFKIDSLGRFIEKYQIPSIFQANSVAKPRHNGTFEATSKSVDNKGFWMGMELPLVADGDLPSVTKTSSPIRITYFDNQTKKATKQFAYQLEPLSKTIKGKVNTNGVSAILEYKKNHFFVVERAYQSGYGSYGNVIRIFEASIGRNTTDILNQPSLKTRRFVPLKKRLLIDFKDCKNKLTKGIIDNIEGITYGPTLANGKQSLLLISDDNFQKYGKQFNQFILLEINRK
ncbi:esterase-like activity of phytase family protein [Tenacibaculum sp. UWU-22]|uniref:esterase-like activity of phytase family protein n=1 Tax=Tenacibaculum sp. UWU-22 TaxID=3234187 RepID=UPI0034DADA23